MNWLEKHHKAIEMLFEVEREASYLKKVHKEAGNDKTSSDFAWIADCLETVRKLSQESVGENLSESVKSADATNAAMLNAILAGVIGKPEGKLT